jgi:hypothetical protein
VNRKHLLRLALVRLYHTAKVPSFKAGYQAPTTAADISMQIEDGRALGSGLVLSIKKPKAITLVKAYLSMLAFVDNPTPAGKASSFVSFSGSKFYVEFEIIASRLRRRVLEAVTRERHGDDGVRVLRLLLDCGKVDEKQVCVYFDLISLNVQSNVHRFQNLR